MSRLNRRLFGAGLFGLGGIFGVSSAEASPEEARRVALHVDEKDPGRMNLALNNARNITRYYEGKGIEVRIRIVAYGPGLHMLREDTSPVKDRIAAMALELPNLSFAACANTRRAMARREGREPPLVEEAEIVPSGVVELVELQRRGWSYIRP